MNQEELVKRLQIKDIMAFERLYDMYRENICGVINIIVRDKSRAEQIAQDVFAKVWTEAPDYTPLKGPFFSWVLHLARQAAMEEVRSTSPQKNKNFSADYLLEILNDSHKDKLLSDASGLKKLAKDLKEKNIEILDLLYFKGYTQRETAELLGIPLSEVKRRNRSSILRIRENMSFEWT